MRRPGLEGRRNEHICDLRKGKGQAVRMRGPSWELLKL
jgi:hypothetical protein